MNDDAVTLPPALAEAHRLGFDFRGGDGVDFEPYPRFLTPEETVRWLRDWTGDPAPDAAAFRIFGQDGTGGVAAFWFVRDGEPLTRQPVAFLGSEGETGVIAPDLDGYLWLLAAGFGPREAMMYPEHEHEPREDVRLTRIAQSWAPSARRPVADIIAEVRDLADRLEAWAEQW
ncbi:hypothetical protein [Saccharomonospora xinjiangensis]|uniref:SMI1/KNR4 family protein n=1 Tax=Saccharomonospora xinjiangensis XJ-54 TaxID=882086 RepID=I0UXW1_9PSEU|nr:hypothetical protein [Saccharomonospora xinjiangensis]EID52714.1 hypothetical protein SacxiDRAFT_0438 [Saccharomonospora xinjiangensis XJ-54]